MNCSFRRNDGNIDIYIIKDENYPSGHMLSHKEIIGCTREEQNWYCNVTGCLCNIWFIIAPKTWKHLEFLTNQEAPKIVKGWNISGHSHYGNFY